MTNVLVDEVRPKIRFNLSSWGVALWFFLFLPSAHYAAGQASQLDAGSNLMLRSRDMHFVMAVSQKAAGASELANLAVEKSKNTAVQSFAKLIIDQSKKINTTLVELVAPQNVTLPGETPAPELAVRTGLQQLSGARFDRTYMKAMAKETAGAVRSFKKEIKKGRDPAVQKFAAETLPVLEDHLEKARSLYRATAGKPAIPPGAEKKQ